VGGTGGGGVAALEAVGLRGGGAGGATSLKPLGDGENPPFPPGLPTVLELGWWVWCEWGLSDRELPAPESRAGLQRR